MRNPDRITLHAFAKRQPRASLSRVCVAMLFGFVSGGAMLIHLQAWEGGYAEPVTFMGMLLIAAMMIGIASILSRGQS